MGGTASSASSSPQSSQVFDYNMATPPSECPMHGGKEETKSASVPSECPMRQPDGSGAINPENMVIINCYLFIQVQCNIFLCTVHTRRYVARVDMSHPLIALSSQFSVTDPLISRMVDSLAAEINPSLITDITFSQVTEISTRK